VRIMSTVAAVTNRSSKMRKTNPAPLKLVPSETSTVAAMITLRKSHSSTSADEVRPRTDIFLRNTADGFRGAYEKPNVRVRPAARDRSTAEIVKNRIA